MISLCWVVRGLSSVVCPLSLSLSVLRRSRTTWGGEGGVVTVGRLRAVGAIATGSFDNWQTTVLERGGEVIDRAPSPGWGGGRGIGGAGGASLQPSGPGSPC